MRFIHCADLHLDSPLRGLERYESAPAEDLRDATRRAFANVVDLALEREADFILVAGDLFDGDWQDFNSGLFFANQLRRLADAGIRAFIVRGNHDAVSRITKSMPWPKNAHVFRATKAETWTDEVLGVAIHGQSFASAAVTDDLAARYPEARSGLLNIGLLHTALAGRAGHEPYAPTTAERLADRGYDYWALGHVHSHETVREAPWIVFPGNTQGRHARETGPKGCAVVEGDADTGIRSVEFVATDVARWQQLTLDTTALAGIDDLEAAVQAAVRAEARDAGDRPLALRLTLAGRSPLHRELAARPEHFRATACAWLNEASGGTAWLEKIRLQVAPPLDFAALSARDDPFGLLLRKLDELADDTDGLARLAESALAELEQKIPAELRERDPALRPLSAEVRAEALAAARDRLLAAISEQAAP